ncbi:MAG: hypothetical protein MZU97_12250 [Bacillus subtilis]|nr:hypothetical protein [Bacillus subtilis]
MFRYYIIMVRRHFPALALILASASLGLSAQAVPSPKGKEALPSAAIEESIFAPFPLRIRVGTRGDGILVTWAEASDPAGGYSVFRSASPIDRVSFQDAERLAEPSSRKPGIPGCPRRRPGVLLCRAGTNLPGRCVRSIHSPQERQHRSGGL